MYLTNNSTKAAQNSIEHKTWNHQSEKNGLRKRLGVSDEVASQVCICLLDDLRLR